jgi:hypothetical protein
MSIFLGAASHSSVIQIQIQMMITVILTKNRFGPLKLLGMQYFSLARVVVVVALGRICSSTSSSSSWCGSWCFQQEFQEHLGSKSYYSYFLVTVVVVVVVVPLVIGE